MMFFSKPRGNFNGFKSNGYFVIVSKQFSHLVMFYILLKSPPKGNSLYDVY